MTTLLAYAVLALGVSFLSSVLEAVILSVSHAHVQVLVTQGSRSGQILRRLKAKIDRPLAAILTLNTVAHTAGAAGVGAQIQLLFGSEWLTVGSVILTFAILVLSEIVPKTIGAVYWKALSPSAAYVILGLVWLTYPFVVSFEALSGLIARRGQTLRVTREEMLVVAEIGASEGELKLDETRIIRNLLRLGSVRTRDILTPRSVMVAYQQDRTVSDIIENETPIRFSRIPVYDEDPDDITGHVLRYQIFESFAKGAGDTKLAEMCEPLHAVPESKSVQALLNDMIAQGAHMNLVVDEHGGTAGLVTLEDAIETLLGLEIVDEFDTVADLRKLAREEWERRRQTQG